MDFAKKSTIARIDSILAQVGLPAPDANPSSFHDAASINRGDTERIQRDTCPSSRKLMHPSRHEAEAVARSCMRRRGKPLRAYQCPECHAWHLTGRV